MELPPAIARMIRHHQCRKDQFDRGRIRQRVAPFLADLDSELFEQENQLRDAAIGPHQHADGRSR